MMPLLYLIVDIFLVGVIIYLYVMNKMGDSTISSQARELTLFRRRELEAILPSVLNLDYHVLDVININSIVERDKISSGLYTPIYCTLVIERFQGDKIVPTVGGDILLQVGYPKCKFKVTSKREVYLGEDIGTVIELDGFIQGDSGIEETLVKFTKKQDWKQLDAVEGRMKRKK